MDALWSGLGIFCIFLGLSMMVFSLNALLKERKMIRHLQAPGEKISPWYTNAILRKYNEFLVDGVLLILFIVGLMLFQKHSAFAQLWASLPLFLFSCSQLTFTLLEEGVTKAVAREIGRGRSRWPQSSRFHVGIAMAIFWIGMSLMSLLNGLVSIKVQTFDATNGMVWFAWTLILIGGLYWLSVYVFREVKRHRVRSSSSSSQSPD
jgi:hypothetical protein